MLNKTLEHIEIQALMLSESTGAAIQRLREDFNRHTIALYTSEWSPEADAVGVEDDHYDEKTMILEELTRAVKSYIAADIILQNLKIIGDQATVDTLRSFLSPEWGNLQRETALSAWEAESAEFPLASDFSLPEILSVIHYEVENCLMDLWN